MESHHVTICFATVYPALMSASVRTQCCFAIGDRSDASELTEALRVGRESINAMARRSGASRAGLQRHARECMGLTSAKGPPFEPAQSLREPPQNVSAEALDEQANHAIVDGVFVDEAPTTDHPHFNNARASGTEKPQQPTRQEKSASEPAQSRCQPAQTQRTMSPVAHHRRPPPTCPDVSSGFEARAGYIADLLSRAKWDRDAEAEHAVRWGVGAGTIAQYKRAATVVLATDRGALREQVEVSVAYGTAQRDQAARMAERNEEIAAEARGLADGGGTQRRRSRDEDDEPEEADPTKALQTETFALKHAREYRKLVLDWQSHLDTLTGVLVTKAPSIQINALVVAQTPEFESVMRCVLDELQATPKVRQRVIERVRGEIDRQRAAGATPIRRMASGG